ncbi:MAG: c-type cytochrome [Acidobacteria bacterium]|nr:c-type cytochrome [Acidobacteriota bacterium]
MTRLRLIALLLACGAATTVAQQVTDRTWSPGVQKAPDESPALSPADEMARFHLPPGFHVELVASEPLIQDPVAIDWDADGRMWVVEYPEFVPDLETPEPNLDPIGRIAVLEDADNDGRMDRRTVFADGLVQARAVKALDHGILVLEPPNVWLMRDTNGDLRMDAKELVGTGYGRREGGVEGNANSFQWGLDNYLHSAGSNVSYSLRLKDGVFDRRPTLSRGEWGVTQDDFGRMFRNSSESTLQVDLVPTPYYARNPTLIRTRGSYEVLTNDVNNINEVWPVRPNPGTNRSYQYGVTRASDGTVVQVTAACAPMVYRGDRLPTELYGNVFVGEPTANFVRRIVLEDDGTTIRARSAYDRAEFLGSTDERFRPVFISSAPDGTLMIVDFYRGVIQDRASTTVYLKNYIRQRKLDAPIGVGMGRVFRVVHDTTRRDPARPQLSRATPAELVAALSHPNGWWRDMAQQLLVERGARAAVPQLAALASDSAAPTPARVKALWVLDGIDAIDVRTITAVLRDRSRDVRTSALRIAERWLADPTSPVQAAVLALSDDPDWQVRAQAAASLGTLAPAPRAAALASLLERHGDEPVVADAALSGARGVERAILEKLLHDAPQTAAHEAAIVMVSATIVRAGQEDAVQATLSAAATPVRAAWQRAAVVRGAEVALVPNTPMPGVARRGAAPSITATATNTPGAPCPTCPGGRAGPGGAYAFEDARGPARGTPPVVAARGRAGGATQGSGIAGRGGGPRLRVLREPTAFTTLAGGTDDLSARAAAVLARIDWPGKPGAAAPAPPLTAAEERRFDAGRELYRDICQACHQPDGRGQALVAPPLVGSTLALAPADVTSRILLNGKEGAVGLMPPIGSTLSDDQIAAVLTYVRREWGQTGDPVDPATVRAVRAQTAARATPWTDDELLALVASRGGQ